MKIIVLISTYNGEKYLANQLDSLLNQDLKPTKILIRDDGSSDRTVQIIEDYCRRYSFINFYTGNNIGPAKSFWDLINKSEKADYYALCDQDDVWFNDKLSTAVETLKKEDNSIPLLYCCRYTLTDKDLKPLNSEISKLYNYTDFPHALLYHTAPGCTFVFNDKARQKILQYDVDKEYCVIHDAIIHKVVAMFGKMILDGRSHMYYRQHGDNEIGMKTGKINVFIKRINNFIFGKIRNYRSKTAKSLLNVYGDECNESYKALLNIVANYAEDFQLKKELLTKKCFRTDTINDVFFVVLVLVNYI